MNMVFNAKIDICEMAIKISNIVSMLRILIDFKLVIGIICGFVLQCDLLE